MGGQKKSKKSQQLFSLGLIEPERLREELVPCNTGRGRVFSMWSSKAFS